jgi:hypothetical protein
MQLHFHSNPIGKCTIHLQAQNDKDTTGKIGSACTGACLAQRKMLESAGLDKVDPSKLLCNNFIFLQKTSNDDGSYMR